MSIPNYDPLEELARENEQNYPTSKERLVIEKIKQEIEMDKIDKINNLTDEMYDEFYGSFIGK